MSGCCGSFVSFTHDRCLPVLGDYCPGMDTSRVEFSHKDHYWNKQNDLPLESEEKNTSPMLNLAQEDNKTKRRKRRPCELNGPRDLCDSQVCKTDGNCRSGCCSQVLTKGYKRCSPMLVGDYCPRALDPVFLLKDAFLDELDAVLQNEEPAVQDEQKEEKFGQADE